MNKRLLWILCGAMCLMVLPCMGQLRNTRDYITIVLEPDHDNWVYAPDEQVLVTLSVRRHYCAIPDMDVRCEWGPELREAEKSWTVNTGKNGEFVLTLKGQHESGFKTLTAKVSYEGKEYTNYINLAISPDRIAPTVTNPDDFDAFWAKAVADVRRVPLQPMMTLQPELCTAECDVYEVCFQNHKPGSYLYGMLSVPKQSAISGQYSDRMPVVIEWPGAGVKPHRGIQGVLTQHGCAVLEMGVNGIPVNRDDDFYRDLKANGLSEYWTIYNDDRDKYYYKKIYAGTVKAADFLCSLPFIDTTRIAVTGGSQGGALSIIHAALDPRVRCLSAAYPALCEIAGYYHGRVGGWPRILREPTEVARDRKAQVSAYYDVVNFARRLHCPVKMFIGYNDRTCCPTSTYAAYNVIPSQKELFLPLDCAHWQYPEHREQRHLWLVQQLNK